MMRVLDPVKKPLFTPDDLFNGYGVGIPFNTYGKVFLFVGSVSVGSHVVPALAVYDLSQGNFIRAINEHESHPVSEDAFLPVDGRLVNGGNQKSSPAYAVYDAKAIRNIIQLFRGQLSAKDELPAALSNLEDGVYTELSP